MWMNTTNSVHGQTGTTRGKTGNVCSWYQNVVLPEQQHCVHSYIHIMRFNVSLVQIITDRRVSGAGGVTLTPLFSQPSCHSADGFLPLANFSERSRRIKSWSCFKLQRGREQGILGKHSDLTARHFTFSCTFSCTSAGGDIATQLMLTSRHQDTEPPGKYWRPTTFSRTTGTSSRTSKLT